MSSKRIVWLLIAACAALIWLSPIGDFIGLLLYVGVYQGLFPATISWDAKNAYVKCYGAIAHPQTWPAPAAAACEAMWLCANEAILFEQQHATLYAQIRRTPGCQEP